MKDILLDAVNGGFLVKNGDFVIGDATLQNQQLLMMAAPGDFKANPSVGVDLSSYLLDEALIGELKARVKTEFERDGMKNVLLRGRSFQTLEVGGNY